MTFLLKVSLTNNFVFKYFQIWGDSQPSYPLRKNVFCGPHEMTILCTLGIEKLGFC